MARAPERVVYDEQKLRQVLINLMSNACKFTNNGRIRLDATVDGLGWLELRVTDSGIGLSEEQKSRLFRPFVQADSSTTRRYGGTGLGLSIVRRLVLDLGGALRIETAPGAGTRAIVELPAGAAPADADRSKR